MRNSAAKQHKLDFVIVGSGFAGALLAWILAKSGRSVMLVDRQTHPRFAIGESSTPLADLLLERLADEFDLPELKPLARWGSWQATYPELGAGLKRGFSYYRHPPGRPFADSASHAASLLVAASADDRVGDTHWLRSDMDQWLVQRAQAAGVRVVEQAQVNGVSFLDSNSHPCLLQLEAPEQCMSLNCRHVVDGSGGGNLLGQFLGLPNQNDRLLTRTAALFGHFQGLGSMTEWLHTRGLISPEDPFDGDLAAQHHLLDDGWVWMLRFHGGQAAGLTSVGIVRECKAWDPAAVTQDRQAVWDQVLDDYPTLAELMSSAELVAPLATSPNKFTQPSLGWLERISRCQKTAVGEHWSMLPSTAGVVDPLHSTGIAHGLSGVQRVARYLLQESTADRLHYGASVLAEVKWIDRLVHAAYLGLRDDFASFSAASKFYLLAAIHSERRLAQDGCFQGGFLLVDSPELAEHLRWFSNQLRIQIANPCEPRRREMLAALGQRLQAWDDVDFFGSGHGNRFSRSAAPK